VVRENADGIEDLRIKVKEGVSKLRGLEVGNELSVEILSRLAEGRRTASELVEEIYQVRSSDEGFYSSYARVRREIRRLESKGLVSTNVLGRNRPYRLTDLAVINLARIGGESKQMPVLPPIDILIYLATAASLIPLLFGSMGRFIDPSEMVTLGLFGLFCLLLGASLTRFFQTLRRVF